MEFKEQKWTTSSPCPGRELFGWRPAATAHPSGSCQPSSSGPEKTKTKLLNILLVIKSRHVVNLSDKLLT